MWRQLIRLAPGVGASLQNQLSWSLVTAILDGHIPHKRPLPSSHELSRQLSVARNTVVHAYLHLTEGGYLIAEERRGYFVNTDFVKSHVTTRAPETVASEQCLPDWKSKFRVRPSLQRNLAPHLRDLRAFEYPFTAGQTDIRDVSDQRMARVLLPVAGCPGDHRLDARLCRQ